MFMCTVFGHDRLYLLLRPVPALMRVVGICRASNPELTTLTVAFKGLRAAVPFLPTVSIFNPCARQTDQIDHDLDHLDPKLLL